MSNYIDELKKLELISTARQLLQADYIQKRTDEYTAWKSNSQNAWRSGNVTIPYPPFVFNAAFTQFQPTTPYPSEEAVVAKALELYNNYAAQQSAPAPAVNTTAVDPAVTTEATVTKTPEVVLDTPMESTVETVTEEVIESAAELSEILEPAVVETPIEAVAPYTDEIFKIYQDVDTTASTPITAEPVLPALEELTVIPQPADELAKINPPGRILPTVLKRLQDMKAGWTTNKGTTE